MMNMTEEYNRLIGKRVKMQRISAKVSQTELAKELGVTQTHLSNIENGRAGLTIPNLIKLHQIWNVLSVLFLWISKGKRKLITAAI